MLPTQTSTANFSLSDAHRAGFYPGVPPVLYQQQQIRGDRKLAFGQLRQAVSSRLCDLLDEAGIHATRVVSGRRFVRWDTVPKLLSQQNAYISGLPYEFFFAKTQGPAPQPQQAPTATATTYNHGQYYVAGAAAAPPPLEEEDNPMLFTGGLTGEYDEIPEQSYRSPPGSFSPPPQLPSEFHPRSSHPRTDVDVNTAVVVAAGPGGHYTYAGNSSPSTRTSNDDDNATEDPTLAQTLVSQLHAQPLNINILSWKKQTIEYILDGLDKHRIRIVPRGSHRNVVFEMELPGGRGGGGMVDIPSWPDVFAHAAHTAHANVGTTDGVGFSTPNSSPPYPPSNNANPTPRESSTGTNASTATGASASAGPSEVTNSSWSGQGGEAPRQRERERRMEMQEYGELQNGSRLHHGQRDVKPFDQDPHERHVPQNAHAHVHQHQLRGSASAASATTETTFNPHVMPPTAHVPLVHNHTLTPAPFRSYHQESSSHPTLSSPAKLRHAHTYPNTQNEHAFGTFPAGTHAGGNSHNIDAPPSHSFLAGAQHISRPVGRQPSTPATETATSTTFLTTPTPTKKWTRRSSPDRIFMNVTLNSLLRSAGMPIPRQKDDASRLPWSSIPQFLAENGLYIRGWPEANLPWLYSGDIGRAGGGGVPVNGAVAGGTGGIGEWRDRIDWKSSPSQRSYKPLAQALRSGDIQILPRPSGRDVLFEVRDAQGRCYDSTLGLSDAWKARWMQDSASASASATGSVPSASVGGVGGGGGEFKFVNLPSQEKDRNSSERLQRQRLEVNTLNGDDEGERERGRPGYHSRSTSYSRSGSSRARNMAMDYELPSPTETTTSISSGATKRQPALSRGFHSSSAFPEIPSRVGYQNLAFHSDQFKPFPLGSSSFPPNRFHEAHTHPRRLTPPVTSYDRDGLSPLSSSSTMRFPPLLNRPYSESVMRFQRSTFPTAESSNNDSRRNTPSPDSSQRQRTVSLGTSSASTGTGTVLSGSSSAVSAPIPPGRGGGGGRYNLPSLSQGAMDVDIDLDDPGHNRLPPIHLKPDDEEKILPFRTSSPLPSLKRVTPSSVIASSFGLALPPRTVSPPSSLPSHLPSPLVAFSQPVWSATGRTWRLTIRDSARASLPPVGDTIVWDMERRSWKLIWAADADGDMRMGGAGAKPPMALWSAEQEAWILDS